MFAGVFGGGDPMAVGTKLIEIGRIVRQSGTSLQELNRSVTDLEHAAPGFSNLVKELGRTFDTALRAFPATNLPEPLKPVHRDFAGAVGSFKEFSAAYDEYVASTKLPVTDLTSLSTKANAALKVKKEWDEFQVSWEKLKSHAPAAAVLPGANGTLLEGLRARSRTGPFAPPPPNTDQPSDHPSTPPAQDERPRLFRRVFRPRE